jgi:hypothetical protein
MQHNISSDIIFGTAIAPQAVAVGASAAGARIVFPAQYGRNIGFLFNVVPGAGVTAFACRLEGSNDNGTSWAPVKQNDGATDLAFTGADFITGGAAAGVSVLGSIPVGRVKYRDLRLNVITVTGGSAGVTVAATFVINNLKNHAAKVQYPAALNQYGQDVASAGQTDYFLNAFLPVGAV